METRSLPNRPNLDQLRRQAKELKDAARAGEHDALERLRPYLSEGARVTLSVAQLAIAREYGFASWPKLKVEIEALRMDLLGRVEAFLKASVGGPESHAARLLEMYPEIAGYDFRTAVILGDAARVQELLAGDPGMAVRPDHQSGWPALLGVCSSRWHRIDPNRVEGMLEVARMLLDAGADPNTRAGSPGQRGHCSSLFGAAGTANNPAITRLLLEHGAIPDDHTVYLSAFFPDHECLQLLLPHVVRIVESTALAAPISTCDIEGVRLLLDAGVDPGRVMPADLLGEDRKGDPPISPVAAAVESQCSVRLIELLLQHGGDPDAVGRDGRSPLRMAMRQGRTDLVKLLERYGARDTLTEVDLFLAACVRADRAEALRLLRAQPKLLDSLTDEDRETIVHAADHGHTEAVRLMLEFDFSVNTHAADDGCTPLHAAAFSGSADLVRLLIDAGADLEAADTTWNSSPLDWAIVGSGMGPTEPHLLHNPHPDYVATVRTLIEAGAVTENVQPGSEKPPSAEVAELLLSYGIGLADDGGLTADGT